MATPYPAEHYRYITFNTVTGYSLTHARTATEARDEAIAFHRLDDGRYLEVIDCGADGRKIWNEQVPVQKVRGHHRIAFRGDGYPHLRAIALQEAE